MSQPESSDVAAQPQAALQDEISLAELAALTNDTGLVTPPPPPATHAPTDDMVSVEELAALQAVAGGKLGTSPTGAPKASTPPPVPPITPSYSGLQPMDQAMTTDTVIDGGISLLMDVPLRVSIELGRISMTLQEVLGLGRGAIIELERLAGEPVDVLINDKLIGHGEVVVVDEYFGVKITELVEPKG